MTTTSGTVRAGAGTLLGCALIAVACAGRGKAGAAAMGETCRAVEGRITADAPWDSLTGDWRLTMVASAGPMAGRQAEGTMTLQVRDPGVRRMDVPGTTVVTVPAIGSTDIALEQVGAVRIGNLQSSDPMQPGLGIWVSEGTDGGVSAVLRIGQEALRTDIVRFDGGYTALYLRQVTGETIRGGWASGVRSQEASGHFCAVRKG